MIRTALALLLLLGGLLAGCGESHVSGDSGPPTADAGPPGDDAGPPRGRDAGPRDAGPPGCAVRRPAKHRARAEACDRERPRPDLPSDIDPTWSDCASHDDCTEGDNGRCTAGRDGYHCSYDRCFADADCDGVCECGGDWGSDGNACKAGNCATDGDCGPEGFCSPSWGDCGDYGGVVGYYCHTCDDECIDDTDCGDGTWGSGYCAYSPLMDRWVCQDSWCAG